MSSIASVMKLGETSVLVVLALLSLASLAIILERFFYLRNYARASFFTEILSKQESTSQLTLPSIALKTLQDHSKNVDQLQLAYKELMLSERMKLEKGLNFLATLGSNAPFIGLLGTVLGIIEAFAALSNSQSGSQAVMSGISQALVATAVGLFVAIPAVIAFNVFSNQIRKAFMRCEQIKENYVRNHFYS